VTKQLLDKANDFRISDFDFRSLSERELARLWRDQTFPPEALVTGAGDRLRVIYRGRPGGSAGPDFRDALIAAPSGLLQGDVELHVRGSDFRRHGHDRDPAYAGVVLHLVFHDDEGGATPLPGGGLAAVVALGDWASGRAAEIQRWLERPALWREPCFSALQRLGEAEVTAALERLGEMRFRQKAAAFARGFGDMGNGKWGKREQVGGTGSGSGLLPASSFLLPGATAEEVLWRALLEALAFGSARDEFGLLAERLPWAELRRRLAPLPARERGSEAWHLLAGAAATMSFSGRGGGRPAGRPERRLQGAARLAARFAEKGLLAGIVSALQEGIPQAPADEAKTGTAKTEIGKTERGAKHGSSHFPFSNFGFRAGERRRSESQIVASLTALLTVPGLIGRSRAVEIIGNAVLPCLAAHGPEGHARLAEALYRRLPLPARYGAVRHLHEAVARVGKNGKRQFENRSSPFSVYAPESCRREVTARGPGVRIDFRRQQGMLYLLKQYCTQGGCGRCPLS